MIKTIEGNILDAEEDIICHQVNCKGVMGAGLAKQSKSKANTQMCIKTINVYVQNKEMTY